MTKPNDPKPRRRETVGATAAVLTLALTLGLGGCATSPASPEETIGQRAQARWDALIAGEYPVAYRYYSPGYRQAVSEEAFVAQQRNRTVAWKTAEVAGADCTDEVCTVRSTVTYTADRPMRGVSRVESVTTVTERWLRSGDAWYFVPDRLR